MIQSLSIKNFLSFRDEVQISFEATKDTHLEDYHVFEVAKGVRLLKLGILYGYNASGKSNLIKAFHFLMNFWFGNVSDKDENIGVQPFLLDDFSRNEPSEFSLVFYHEKVKYSYFLRIKGNTVLREEIKYYPGTQPANIFKRIFENGVSKIEFGNKIRVSPKANEEITLRCLKNVSVFSAYNQVNVQIEKLETVSLWMKYHVMPIIEPTTHLKDYTAGLIHEVPKAKEFVLEYLQEADFNIVGINSKGLKKSIPDEILPLFLQTATPTEIEDFNNNKTIEVLNTNFVHSTSNQGSNENHTLDLYQQSEGTQRVFGLSGAVFQTIKQDAFLTIDEIESKLHPRLIEYVLERFLRESKQAQILVATHYDNLFDEDDLLRKDNFWFTEKEKCGSTKLFPLSGFTGLGRISSLQKAYKYGKFGAVPNID